ncbi:amino acid adenylation domain-containing protein [Flavobacterium polysaccharolyticum]|uniref:Amino acid adenylation domain-containing protein n=1 Tax=Flavobacterium polysaccharolyticum TaxID=3133148 RepID=A0ABU9NX59_9FLAO
MMEKEILNNIEGYQLSINQMNLWSVAKSNVQAYYNQVVIDIGNAVTIEELQRGLTRVVSKNETLLFKMSMTSNAVFPVQIVSEMTERIAERTVQTLDKNTIEAQAQECLGEQYNPLKNDALRICLLKDSDGNQVLVVRLFSFWADTYSATFLCNELSKALQNEILYEKEAREFVEYQDFAVWQQQLFSNPEEEGINFWKNYTIDLTQDIVPFKNKTTDFFAPQRQAVCTIENNAYEALKAKSIQEDCSVEHILLSKYAVYLSRFGEDSFTLGYLPFKRFYNELENTVGLVSKTLPIQLKDLTTLSEKEVNAHLKKSVEETKMWSDYFYVNRIHDKKVSDATIFKYVFEFLELNQNNSSNHLKIRDIYSVTDVFELKLSVVDYDDKLVIELYYDASCYTIGAINLIAAQLKNFFTNESNNLAGQAIIAAANNTVKLYESFNSVTTIFEQQVISQGNNTALFDENISVSYQELDRKVNQFSQYLIEKYGIKKGDAVAVLLDRSPDFVISILGILKAGAYYIPMDIAYPKNRIQFILQDAACTVLVTTPPLSAVNNFSDIRILDPSKKEIFQAEVNPSIFNVVDPQDIAYCIYTSGSTGNPKGCLITHANLLNYIQWSNEYYFEDSETGNWGLITSISFDLTITSLFTSLTRGKKLWIGSDAKTINELLTESFTNPQIDTLKLTPSHLSLLRELNIEKTNIKIVICGGEQLTQNQLQNVWNIDRNIRIFNEYGPTETTVGCIVKEMTPDQSHVSIGKPIANTFITIADPCGNICDVGVYGEIIISGAGVAQGYLNRPELNSERFINTRELSSYKTGDIARWLDNGDIIYKERKDDQVKIRGYRIELSEIEQQLMQHEAIDQAVVLADDRNNCEKELVAYIVCAQNEDTKWVKRYLEYKLPEYMIPSVILLVDAIPLTVNGKVDKKQLLTLNTGKISRAVYVEPANEIEAQIVEIWKKILQVDQIGTLDDFYELGGHSLKAIQLINQYHKAFEVKLGLKQIFANSTIKSHANLIKNTEVTVHTAIQKVPDAADYPVSAGQRRLWVLSQTIGSMAVYNMPFQTVLKGSYDLSCLSQAIEATLDRHEALRTVFKVNDEGEVRQVVKTTKELGFIVNYIDYRADLHQETNVSLYIKEDTNVPFDLKNGPLVRASILQLSDQDYIFYYNLHHIICDGWSMDVLEKDVLAFYEYYSAGKEPELPLLKIQYRDYSVWQQEQLQKEQNNFHKAYWLKSLAGELPTLDLPYQKTRPAVKTYVGNSLRTYISPEITNQLRKYGQNQGGSLFVGLLSVLNILFYKYTSDNDLIIGTPVAGRDHVDLNHQIGFYINTLPLRNIVNAEDSFDSFYNTVKENTILSFEHQMYPFDRLVDDLDIRNDTSRSAIFDVMLMLQNIRDINENEILDNTAFSLIENKGYKVAKFDMDIAFQEQGDYLSFNITYNTDLYSEESVFKFINHYKQLLEVLLQNPEEQIKNIEYISESERHQLIYDFNNNVVSYPKDKTLIDLFTSKALKYYKNKALFFNGLSYSYKELDRLSNQLANCLKDDFKVVKGDFIGVELERNANVIISILGIMKAGAVYIPIDTAYPESRKSYIYEDTKIRLLISDQSSVTYIDNYNGTVFDIVNDFKPFNYSDEVNGVNLTPDDLAYIIYTSGSTGNPKGVMIEHKGIVNTILAQIALFDISANDNGLQFASFSFDASISEIFTALLSGACLCVIDTLHRNDPKMLEKYIVEQKIDIATIPPSYMSLMSIKNLGKLKTLITAGEPPVYNKVKEYLELGNYYNAYGPTETSICSAMYGLLKGDQLPLANIPIGKPIANTQTFILDKENKIVPVGIVGEICVGGTGLAKGYLNRPELTAEKFIAHPFIENERLYKTGDLGKWLPDGNIEFLGRKDDQVKISGYRIELSEIEQVLTSHDHINEAVVQVDINEFNIKSLIAYIITKESLSLEQLRVFLKNTIPHYCIPSTFIVLEQLPVTINGKIDKKQLANVPGIKIVSEKQYIAPQSQKEKVIIEIIARELKIEPTTVSILDNFFDLGANSIKIVKIMNEINKQLELDVRVVSLFENPNIEEFVQYLDTIDSQEKNNLEEPEDISEAFDEFISLM